MHLRSVELQMPNRAAAVDFLKGPWGLIEVGARAESTYLRGTGAHHYAIAVTAGSSCAVSSVTFVGTRGEVEAAGCLVKAAKIEPSD
jgi:2,3-dihydroxy-p-cumate/2,3-dihydroxybenzoate 3,4-dioxygenase